MANRDAPLYRFTKRRSQLPIRYVTRQLNNAKFVTPGFSLEKSYFRKLTIFYKVCLTVFEGEKFDSSTHLVKIQELESFRSGQETELGKYAVSRVRVPPKSYSSTSTSSILPSSARRIGLLILEDLRSNFIKYRKG